MQLREALTLEAERLGFVRIGFAAIGALGVEQERLREWVAKGRHASMAWMVDSLEVRCDPRAGGFLPEARSVIVLAATYSREELDLKPGKVARYASGKDYHAVVGKRVQRFCKQLRQRGFKARGGTDLLPIFERAWAAKSGVGFVGKNACLIIPGIGSYVFLAAVVTDADLVADTAIADRCGTCTLCIDACPTGAIKGPGEIDARECISYLTIEHRGDYSADLRPLVGDHLFGCDDCQTVCPFNQGTAAARVPILSGLKEKWAASLEEVVSFARDSGGHLPSVKTALSRCDTESLIRNVAVVSANTGAQRALPILIEARKQYRSISETLDWAIAQLTASA